MAVVIKKVGYRKQTETESAFVVHPV